MHYKLKVYMLAVLSKLRTRKKGFSPCFHICLFCKYKTHCAFEQTMYEKVKKK